MRPGTWVVCRWDPGNRDPKMSRWDLGPETRDPKIFKQNSGPGTHLMGPEVRNPKLIKCNPGPLIFYSFHRLFLEDLNTLHFTCYKNLH